MNTADQLMNAECEQMLQFPQLKIGACYRLALERDQQLATVHNRGDDGRSVPVRADPQLVDPGALIAEAAQRYLDTGAYSTFGGNDRWVMG